MIVFLQNIFVNFSVNIHFFGGFIFYCFLGMLAIPLLVHNRSAITSKTSLRNYFLKIIVHNGRLIPCKTFQRNYILTLTIRAILGKFYFIYLCVVHSYKGVIRILIGICEVKCSSPLPSHIHT